MNSYLIIKSNKGTHTQSMMRLTNCLVDESPCLPCACNREAKAPRETEKKQNQLLYILRNIIIDFILYKLYYIN